jgi:hypothetical protein
MPDRFIAATAASKPLESTQFGNSLPFAADATSLYSTYGKPFDMIFEKLRIGGPG